VNVVARLWYALHRKETISFGCAKFETTGCKDTKAWQKVQVPDNRREEFQKEQKNNKRSDLDSSARKTKNQEGTGEPEAGHVPKRPREAKEESQ
jgi:hypothetical protein